MLQRGFFSLSLAATLIALAQPAAAQNYKGKPKRTIQDYGPFPKAPPKSGLTTKEIEPETTGKCGNPAHSCLFYGGDFLDNPLYPPSLPNGLANESTINISGYPYGAATWVPFTVPAGETWYVDGLFTNNQTTYGVLDQGTEPTSVAYWSINEEVFPGSAGIVVDSGTSPATSTPTGRSAFSLDEYTIQVTGLSVTLTPGRYWLAVVPICTNSANPYCDGVFFLSDVEYLSSTPAHAFGSKEPMDASYFDSPYFGLSVNPTNGAVGACAGSGCDTFSAGVLGQINKK